MKVKPSWKTMELQPETPLDVSFIVELKRVDFWENYAGGFLIEDYAEIFEKLIQSVNPDNLEWIWMELKPTQFMVTLRKNRVETFSNNLRLKDFGIDCNKIINRQFEFTIEGSGDSGEIELPNEVPEQFWDAVNVCLDPGWGNGEGCKGQGRIKVHSNGSFDVSGTVNHFEEVLASRELILPKTLHEMMAAIQ